MRERTNCPNCGAPITSEQCEFCGTLFYDFSAIEIGKPCYLKIKHNNQIIMVRAIANDACVEMHADTIDVTDMLGSTICSVRSSINMDLSLGFHCVPFEDNANHIMEVRVI